MTAPTPSRVRFTVDPGDVSPEKAARHMHMTIAEFKEKLPELLDRGFPPADPTTGNYDLDAIKLWRAARFPRLYGLTPLPAPAEPAKQGMGERFVASKSGKRHDSAA